MAPSSNTAETDARPGAPPGEAAIFAEQVRLLYRLSRVGYVGTLINAAIIVLALWPVSPPVLLLSWFALVIAVTAARFALYRKYLAGAPAADSAAQWCKRFVIGAIAMGCLWGLLGSALLPEGEILHQFLILFLVGGMVASAVAVLTPVHGAFLGFMLAALLPITAAVFLQGGQTHVLMGVLILVFAAVMLGASAIMYQTHLATLRVRFENSDLVSQLSGANRRLEHQLEERGKIEAQLQQSSTRLEALVTASPLAIIVQNERGIVKRWNPAAERMFGWTEREVVGRPAPHVPPDQAATVARDRESTLHGERFADVETIRQRKDGSPIAVSISAAPLHDAAGVASGMVVIAADISERKKSERLRRLEHTVTRVLSEAHSVEEAVPEVLRAICEISGWSYGGRWILSREDQKLHCTEAWYVPSAEVTAFAESNVRRVTDFDVRPGGLLRAVWRKSGPVWIADLAADGTLNRARAAVRAGLRSAFAFPILILGKFYGVMEFFGPATRPRDESLERIAMAIGSQVGQFIARKEAESHLTFFANHDSLTGLHNRAMFNHQLTQALARARRYQKMIAVLFIDLDRFKVINDTLGHDAGDRTLKQLAGRLRDCLREGDTIGRQGGDEFVVLLQDVSDPNQVSGAAHKLLEAVAQPHMLSDQEFHVTASIGISIYPDDGADLQTLLKNADIAMYRAKEQGRNNFQFYSAQMNVHTFERLALETSLRRAIERQEFLLHYQPKVDIRSGRITGVEALVRWRHPDLGMVLPAQFIALAEETGLILPIGEWVLRTACQDARAWAMQGLPATSVAVNLSARQFGREGLVAAIADVLRDSGLDPHLLELEITESVVMHNADRAAAVLRELREMGIRIAIDDFGTGYSSLGYLKRFPIDSVKIDRSFILDIPNDQDDVAITQAVIAMAHGLRLKVIAEGVETDEQYRFLMDHDCDEMQGYRFSGPVDAAALARLLAQAPPQVAAGRAPFKSPAGP